LRAPIEILSIVWLARILSPDDFGRVAMVASLTAFVRLFRDLGLSSVAIQRPTLDDAAKSTLFWLNIGLGLALTLATVAAAPLAAWFYDAPELAPVTAAMGLQFVLASAGAPHLAFLRRDFAMGTEAMLKVLASALALVAALSVAWAGGRWWALVASGLVSTSVLSASAWFAHPWRPRLRFDRTQAGQMLSMGSELTGFQFANYFARNLDDIIIGKAFGPTAAGFYQKAYELLTLPIREINAPASSVALATLSRLVDEPERYCTAYRRIVQKVLVLTIPLGAVMMVVPEIVIEAVFGSQWRPAAALVRPLSLLMFTQPIAHTASWLFVSQGRSNEMLRWGILGATLSSLSFFAGLPWGAAGVAAAYALSGVTIRLPILLGWVGRKGPVTRRTFGRVVGPFLPGALAAVAALAGLRPTLLAWGEDGSLWPLAALLVAVLVALAGSGLGLTLLPGGRRVLRETHQAVLGRDNLAPDA
jgi:PST family polysaccharide transporter